MVGVSIIPGTGLTRYTTSVMFEEGLDGFHRGLTEYLGSIWSGQLYFGDMENNQEVGQSIIGDAGSIRGRR